MKGRIMKGMRNVNSYFRRIMSFVLLLVALITMPCLIEATFVITARKQPPRELTPAERIQWEQEQEHENMVMKICSGYDEFAPCSCAEVLINTQVYISYKKLWLNLVKIHGLLWRICGIFCPPSRSA